MDAGAARGFWIALLFALGLPPVAFLATNVVGGDANLFSAFVLPPLAGAYPFTVIPGLPFWLAVLLSSLQMIVLAFLFARRARLFRVSEQCVVALIALGLLALAGDVAYAILDVDVSRGPIGWM
jgi:hypothetical protein